jgi:elongation factor G
MKEYTPDLIRNIALIGHGNAGKTSFAEALLYASGMTNRLGKVEDSNTTSDFQPDEIERKISISASLLHCEWKGIKLNIIDTPGYSDFTGEVKCGLKITDTALVFLKAVEGLEVGTEIVWEYTREYKNGSIFIINKLDNENADYEKTVNAAKERFGNDVFPIQFPVKQGLGFEEIVDVLRMKAFKYARDGRGKFTEIDIPSDLKSKSDDLHAQLIEKIAESDENLLNTYFEKGALTEEEIKNGLRNAIRQRKIFPILCSSSTHLIGITAIMDFITDYCPNPQEMPEVKAISVGSNETQLLKSAPNGHPVMFIFKTLSESHLGELSFFRVYSGTVAPGLDLINHSNGKAERLSQLYVLNGRERKEVAKLYTGDIAAAVKLKDSHTNNTLSSKTNPVLIPDIKFPEPVIYMAIAPKAKGDEDKIANGLHTFHAEDLTFIVTVDAELHQTVVSGQGELHLTILAKRLKARYGVEVDLVEPKIPYRETIKGVCKEVEYKHKKQSGGRGQFGHVLLKIEPKQRGSGFEFEDAIVGGVVPGRFIPAVEKGIIEAMESGVVSGNKVVDVKVTLFYGSYHTVDSDEHSFKIAGRMGFKKGFKEAKPIILEPIYELEVTVPEEYMGDVMGDISSRRGKILGMESNGFNQVIKALLPLKELYRYSTNLRSMTQGRGIHKQKFSFYEEVPREVMEKIITEYEKSKTEEVE